MINKYKKIIKEIERSLLESSGVPSDKIGPEYRETGLERQIKERVKALEQVRIMIKYNAIPNKRRGR